MSESSKRQSLRDVIASTEFEGETPSPEAVELAAQVISGRITADEAVVELLGLCPADRCPPAICGGPHRIVVTTLGNEILRADQAPIGRPL